jgi:hypothetical protein
MKVYRDIKHAVRRSRNKFVESITITIYYNL